MPSPYTKSYFNIYEKFKKNKNPSIDNPQMWASALPADVRRKISNQFASQQISGMRNWDLQTQDTVLAGKPEEFMAQEIPEKFHSFTINDVKLSITPEQITISEESLPIKSWVIRSSGMAKVKSGRSSMYIGVTIPFVGMTEISTKLLRLLVEIRTFPIVYLKNELLSQVAQFGSPGDNLAGVVSAFTLTTHPEALNTLVLHLDMELFNYKPYSTGFLFQTIAEIPLNLKALEEVQVAQAKNQKAPPASTKEQAVPYKDEQMPYMKLPVKSPKDSLFFTAYYDILSKLTFDKGRWVDASDPSALLKQERYKKLLTEFPAVTDFKTPYQFKKPDMNRLTNTIEFEYPIYRIFTSEEVMKKAKLLDKSFNIAEGIQQAMITRSTGLYTEQKIDATKFLSIAMQQLNGKDYSSNKAQNKGPVTYDCSGIVTCGMRLAGDTAIKPEEVAATHLRSLCAGGPPAYVYSSIRKQYYAVKNNVIPVRTAKWIPGALLFRRDIRGHIDHVAISLGDGKYQFEALLPGKKSGTYKIRHEMTEAALLPNYVYGEGRTLSSHLKSRSGNFNETSKALSLLINDNHPANDPFASDEAQKKANAQADQHNPVTQAQKEDIVEKDKREKSNPNSLAAKVSSLTEMMKQNEDKAVTTADQAVDFIKFWVTELEKYLQENPGWKLIFTRDGTAVLEKRLKLTIQDQGHGDILPWATPVHIASSLQNIFARIPMMGHIFPTHQYMGSGDHAASLTFHVIGNAKLAELQRMQRYCETAARKLRRVPGVGVIKIKNDILNLMGTQNFIIDSLSYETVPDSPNLYKVDMRISEWKRDYDNSENPVLEYATSVDAKEAILKRLSEYFLMMNPRLIRDQGSFVPRIYPRNPDEFVYEFEKLRLQKKFNFKVKADESIVLTLSAIVNAIELNLDIVYKANVLRFLGFSKEEWKKKFEEGGNKNQGRSPLYIWGFHSFMYSKTFKGQDETRPEMYHTPEQILGPIQREYNPWGGKVAIATKRWILESYSVDQVGVAQGATGILQDKVSAKKGMNIYLNQFIHNPVTFPNQGDLKINQNSKAWLDRLATWGLLTKAQFLSTVKNVTTKVKNFFLSNEEKAFINSQVESLIKKKDFASFGDFAFMGATDRAPRTDSRVPLAYDPTESVIEETKGPTKDSLLESRLPELRRAAGTETYTETLTESNPIRSGKEIIGMGAPITRTFQRSRTKYENPTFREFLQRKQRELAGILLIRFDILKAMIGDELQRRIHDDLLLSPAFDDIRQEWDKTTTFFSGRPAYQDFPYLRLKHFDLETQQIEQVYTNPDFYFHSVDEIGSRFSNVVMRTFYASKSSPSFRLMEDLSIRPSNDDASKYGLNTAESKNRTPTIGDIIKDAPKIMPATIKQNRTGSQPSASAVPTADSAYLTSRPQRQTVMIAAESAAQIVGISYGSSDSSAIRSTPDQLGSIDIHFGPLGSESRVPVRIDRSPEAMMEMLNKAAVNWHQKTFCMRRMLPAFKFFFVEHDTGPHSEDLAKVYVRSYDDFFAYNAIKSIKLIKSRKMPADLLIIRLSNLFGHLDNAMFSSSVPSSQTHEDTANGPKKSDNHKESLDPWLQDTDKEHQFAKLVLKEGMTTYLSLGYENNTKDLTRVFNGQVVQINQVSADEIVLVCQSFGTQLVAFEKGAGPENPYKTEWRDTFELLSFLICQPEMTSFGRWKINAQSSLAESRSTGGWEKIFEFLKKPQDDNIFAPNREDVINYIADLGALDLFFGRIHFPVMQTIKAMLGFGSIETAEKGGKVGVTPYLYDEKTKALKPTPNKILVPFCRSRSGKGSKILDYYINRTTIWDVFKEMELRHPGWIGHPIEYGDRMTMFFGLPSQFYWSRPPNTFERTQYRVLTQNLKRKQEEIEKIYGSQHSKTRMGAAGKLLRAYDSWKRENPWTSFALQSALFIGMMFIPGGLFVKGGGLVASLARVGGFGIGKGLQFAGTQAVNAGTTRAIGGALALSGKVLQKAGALLPGSAVKASGALTAEGWKAAAATTGKRFLGLSVGLGAVTLSAQSYGRLQLDTQRNLEATIEQNLRTDRDYLFNIRTGRLKQYRDYHLFDADHHIIANNIKASSHGVYNAVSLKYQDDIASDVRAKADPTKMVTEQLKASDRILDKDVHMLSAHYPNCRGIYMAQRYTQGLLLRHMKDIYKGSLFVIGEPKVKPYDRVLINDSYSDIVGQFDVKEVIHTLSPEDGFMTEITPDLVMYGNNLVDMPYDDYNAIQMLFNQMSWSESIQTFMNNTSYLQTVGRLKQKTAEQKSTADKRILGQILSPEENDYFMSYWERNTTLGWIGGAGAIQNIITHSLSKKFFEWTIKRQPIIYEPLMLAGRPYIAGVGDFTRTNMIMFLKEKFRLITQNMELGASNEIRATMDMLHHFSGQKGTIAEVASD